MARVMAGDRHMKTLEIGGTSYRQRRDGSFDVRDEHLRAAKAGAECFEPGIATRGGRVFPCECGHRSLFALCGRCGRTNPQEA